MRGTKNPDTDRIIALEPDLVVANFEENRQADLDILRAAGIPVWVTVIRTLPEALSELARMLAACGLDEPPWLAAARTAWADVLEEPPPPSRTAVVPIWRRPWMVLGRDTFAGDVLARLGVANAYADRRRALPEGQLLRLVRGRAYRPAADAGGDLSRQLEAEGPGAAGHRGLVPVRGRRACYDDELVDSVTRPAGCCRRCASALSQAVERPERRSC